MNTSSLAQVPKSTTRLQSYVYISYSNNPKPHPKIQNDFFFQRSIPQHEKKFLDQQETEIGHPTTLYPLSIFLPFFPLPLHSDRPNNPQSLFFPTLYAQCGIPFRVKENQSPKLKDPKSPLSFAFVIERLRYFWKRNEIGESSQVQA
jgi:hypothetical protein